MDGADKIIELFLAVGAVLALAGVLYALAEEEKEAERRERLQRRIDREANQFHRLNRDHEKAASKLSALLPSVDGDHVNYNYLSRLIQALNKEECLRTRTTMITNLTKEVRESKYTLLARHKNRIPDEKLFCPAWDGSKEVVEIRDYQVNLADRTCSCDYMQTIDESIALEDVRRVCRHQVEAARLLNKQWLYKVGQINTSYARAIINKWARERHYAMLHFPGWGTFMLGYDLPLDWVSIWMDNEDKFSYSLLQKRWSYGDSPRPHTDQARQAILDYFELSAFRKR